MGGAGGVSAQPYSHIYEARLRSSAERVAVKRRRSHRSSVLAHLDRYGLAFGIEVDGGSDWVEPRRLGHGARAYHASEARQKVRVLRTVEGKGPSPWRRHPVPNQKTTVSQLWDSEPLFTRPARAVRMWVSTV